MHGDQIPSNLDLTKRKLDILQGQATANDFYSPSFGEEPPAYSASYVDPGEIADQEEEDNVDRGVNVRAYRDYVNYWRDAAIKSGAITPAFFDSYKFIVQVPAPAVNASEEVFTKAVDNIALAIKQWYVAAQYSGDLGQLSTAIDATKPKYQPIPPLKNASKEGMTTLAASAAPFRPLHKYNETAVLFAVIGLGLAGVCFYKACACK